jgi:hypothetical protein
VDGLMTSVTMKGPSKRACSLCMFSVSWIRLRTRSPTLKEALGLDHGTDGVVGRDELA